MKEVLKKPLYALAVKKDCAILVASMGRSGSTLLTKSCRQAMLDNKGTIFGYDFSKHLHKDAWDLKQTTFQKGCVYKTHDFAPGKPLPDFVKVIYTYTHPLDCITAIELKLKEFGDIGVRQHFQHLKAEYQPIKNAQNNDIFNYEKNYNSWITNTHNFDFLAIRYDQIWEQLDLINQFTGLTLKLPPFKERKASQVKHSPKKVQAVGKTYASLIEKIESTPFFMHQKHN